MREGLRMEGGGVLVGTIPSGRARACYLHSL